MAVVELKTKQEFDDAKKTRVLIVDFTASWCGPCRMIGPKFVEIAAANPKDDVKFVKVDVDENEEVAQECGISAMPTFQVFVDGEKKDELVGASEEKLKEMIAKYVQ